MSNECITRRAFIGAALGAGMLLISTPSVALADEQYAATPGRSIDPHSVSMAGSRTLSSISSSHCLTELRRGLYDGSYWLWVRTTVYKSSNYDYGGRASLTTPYGSTDGARYGGGNNLTVGSVMSTAAICIGIPSSAIRVTYSGWTDWPELIAYRTVTIPAESISRTE